MSLLSTGSKICPLVRVSLYVTVNVPCVCRFLLTVLEPQFCSDMVRCTHIHTHTYIHTYIHTYTHIYTHIHIYTHTHTHTQCRTTHLGSCSKRAPRRYHTMPVLRSLHWLPMKQRIIWRDWRCSSVVERWSLTGEISLACTRPAADG